MKDKNISFFRFVRLCIIVFWAVMMVMLVQKTYFNSYDDYIQPSYAASQLRPREEWMGIYWKEAKVGYTVSKIKRRLKGYEIYEHAIMDLTVMGTQQRIDTQVTSRVDDTFTLQSFEFRLFSNLFIFEANGKVRGNKLHMELVSSGSSKSSIIPLKETPCLASSIKPLILSKGLMVGKKFRHTIFDPSTMSSAPVEMVVEGKETVVLRNKKIKCYKIRSTFKGITLRSWIDEEGNTIKEESPMGLMLVKETQADALTENWGETAKDLMAASAISVNRPITLSNPSYLKVRLSNIKFEDFDLSQGRQELRGDVLEVSREKLSGLESYQIPHPKGDMGKYLEPTTFIQSNDGTMIKKAREIMDDEKDALKAVNLIKEWVYLTIEKRPTLSIPSALDVLKMKVGDCNEHTTLFVALCRAAGIPSKFCAGIVYNQGSFYYHAWSDVFVGNWVSVDPTMNQLPADATHIQFVEGGLDKQLIIVNLVGIVKLEVLAYK